MKTFVKYLTMSAVIGACSTAALNVHAQAKPSETEVLQKATSLAIGNLAWESVRVSEIQKDGAQVKWFVTLRSNKYRCSADANGENSSCDPVPGAAMPPAGPAPVRAPPPPRAAPAPALIKNMVSVASRDRSYLYYVSSKYSPAGFNMVVYALHDKGQTAEQFAQQSGWMKLAEDNGFVVVFPEAGPQGWAANSGGDDAFVKAVYDHAVAHLMVRGGPGGAGAPGGEGGRAPRGGGEGEAPRPGAAPGGGEGGGGGGGGRRAQTWLPFHYLTGSGAGATVAQEFVLNHPGVFAAVATLDGGAYPAAYAKGAEPAQGYFQDARGGKNAKPVWKPLKKDVPVAAWLFTTGAPTPAESQLADYWKRSDAVAPTASNASVGGFPTAIYRNPTRAPQEVRVTSLGEGAKYDKSVASAIWTDFFSHVARWTSSPNGDLGGLLTEAEVNKTFDVRTTTVDGATYKYYVKTPSTYKKGQSLPLVVSAHGAFFPAWLYLSQIKMHEVGEKEGFITVYINGQQNRWDFTKADGPDAKFVEQAIAEVGADYGVDKSRVYMQGFSLGSGLSYMMGITHPQLFAAVSPNSGIGPMTPEVKAWVADLKAKSDVRMPMMIVYGDVDGAASTDAKIPAQGVLRGAIDEMKQYNNIATPDKAEPFNSPNTAPYDVLVLGGKAVRDGVDARYPKGRFQISEYSSKDAKPLNLFNFVWVTDMSHGGDPRQAQLEWDYFKQWRRGPDAALTFAPR
ncbi:MAG: Poly(3-hydroxybutyrate) depolymerase-like protein [Caulobacter sp.]|nr:Poly(3-hydroxybutyrate) depolymerase-like protein [Caulobacter sp.]